MVNTGFEKLSILKSNSQCYSLNTKKFGVSKSGSKYLGGVPLLVDSESNKIYIDDGDTHTLVFGATGSLKTRTVVMPTVRIVGEAGESMVINDAKGELYARLGEELHNNGYEIKILNLRDSSLGNSWNPLFLPYKFYLEGDIDRACEFANDVASNLMIDGTSSDPFWEISASDTMFGLILWLFKYAKEFNLPEAMINISSIIQLRHELFSPAHGRPAGILGNSYIWKYVENDELIATALRGSVFAPNETRASILATWDSKIRSLSIRPTLLEMLANNDIDIADLGRKKMALFLIVPDEKTTYHVLVSLFIKQSYEYLIYTASKNQGGRLGNRVNYILDEFSSLPVIGDFPAMITASRSRDMRFLLVVQSKGSLEKRYKEEAETIMANCSNWIFFTSRELPLLRQLSELCGMKANGKEPNISIYELQQFDKSKCEALLLAGRLKPAKVNLIDIDDPLFGQKSYNVLTMPKGQGAKREPLNLSNIAPKVSETPFVNTDLQSQKDEKKPKPLADMDIDAMIADIDKKIAALEEKEKREKASKNKKSILNKLKSGD